MTTTMIYMTKVSNEVSTRLKKPVRNEELKDKEVQRLVSDRGWTEAQHDNINKDYVEIWITESCSH